MSYVMPVWPPDSPRVPRGWSFNSSHLAFKAGRPSLVQPAKSQWTEALEEKKNYWNPFIELNSSAQGSCFHKMTADISCGWLGKVWWGGSLFQKMKITESVKSRNLHQKGIFYSFKGYKKNLKVRWYPNLNYAYLMHTNWCIIIEIPIEISQGNSRVFLICS